MSHDEDLTPEERSAAQVAEAAKLFNKHELERAWDLARKIEADWREPDKELKARAAADRRIYEAELKARGLLEWAKTQRP